MIDPQTEAYRQTSITLSAAAALYASQAIAAVDTARLIPSLEEIISAILGPSSAAADRVISLARGDYYATRRAAGVTGTAPEWVDQRLSREALRRSLYATVGETLQGIERFDVAPAAALKRARVQAGGVVTRQVMNAGRNSTIATAQGDARVIGCLYVTREDANVCYWCLMLASRGPVFGSESYEDADRLFTGVGTAKSHDSCRCVVKPVYSTGSPLLDRSHELEKAWRAVNWENGQVKNSGKAALKAWRRHVAAQRAAGDPLFGQAA